MTGLPSSRRHQVLLVASVLLVATNLRAPFTSVGVVLHLVGDDYGLSASQLGAFSALPLLVFALLSPFVGRIARRWGIEWALFAAVLTLTLGSFIRVLGPLSSAIGGTLLVGAGIAIGNVLIPSLLKRDFPNHIGPFTALYGISMATLSAIGSAIAMPLAAGTAMGWRASLGVFAIWGVLTTVIWSLQLPKARPKPVEVTRVARTRIWTEPLAWQVTIFLGLNSFLYYITIAWVPSILVAQGFSEESAGSIHGLMQLTSGTAGLAMAPFLARMRDQRGIAVVAGLGLTVSLLGLHYMPQQGALWALVLGFFGGAVFLLGLAFTGMRARTVEEAASLTGMAQSLGYLLATTGPSIAGWLYDRSQRWDSVIFMCVSISLVITLAGWFAGRDRQLGER